MRDLEFIAWGCTEMLDMLEIPYGTVSVWNINTRAKKRWGQCKRLPNGTFEININHNLLKEENDLKLLQNTILHELLHTIDGCLNHGRLWKAYAQIVNDAYGYDIKRLAPLPNGWKD